MNKYVFVLSFVFANFLGLVTYSQVASENKIDDFYGQDQPKVSPAPLPEIRKADIMWSKRIWREIDFKQKINQKFFYPVHPRSDTKSFITTILDAVREGTLTAYDINNTDELIAPLSYDEIIGREEDTSYVTMRRPYPPYDEYDTVIISEFDPTRIMRLRVKEDWYFDKKRSQMLVRIESMCPVIIKEIEGEEVTKPLFWFSYDEARPILANTFVFNPDNSAQRLSYDDVFIKRIFDSYIYKEQNTFDRRISQYALGVDALLEGQRIENDLIDFEQFLWAY